MSEDYFFFAYWCEDCEAMFDDESIDPEMRCPECSHRLLELFEAKFMTPRDRAAEKRALYEVACRVAGFAPKT